MAVRPGPPPFPNARAGSGRTLRRPPYASAGPLRAGRVTAFLGGSGPGLDSMPFNNLDTPAPGNDNVAGVSLNYISVHQNTYNAVSDIDRGAAFVVSPPGDGLDFDAPDFD